MLAGSATMTMEPLTQVRRRQLTREHLLDAAAQVFAERGFHGATLDEVARVAGFTKGAVYSNFASKDDLFLALFKANYEREMEGLVSILGSSRVPPGDRLADFVALIQKESGQTSATSLLNQEFWLYAARNPEARARLVAIDEEAIQALADLLQRERRHEGLEPLDDDVRAARVIEVLFRGIGLLRVMQPEVVDDEFLEAAIEFVARGLGAGGGGLHP
jgi:AcrR family transcriptional regulator